MQTFILVYLLVINAIAFFVYFIDKYNAKHDLYRVSEKALILLALFGGSVGALVSMLVFRHKTKHLFFTFGVPLIIVLQLAVAYLILF